MDSKVIEMIDTIYHLIKNEIRALYLVGGAVRDDLMGISSKDFDISLDTDFDNMSRISRILEFHFSESKIQYIKEFHNVKLNSEGLDFDLVPFRKEIYDDNSNYPSISKGTFIDDVMRRDFTINSIYLKYDGMGGFQMLDPLGGSRDIESKIIKLNYKGSFNDDPTRIIRLFIYQHRLKFEICQDDLDAINPTLMDKISPSLIFSLVQGLLKEPHAYGIMSALIERNLLKSLGITQAVEFNSSETTRDILGKLLEANPMLIKTFEDLGIYSKLLRKKEKGGIMSLTIKINEFEGPFDVLLHLIERDEMDIYNIRIHQITSEYISYLESMKQIDMVIAAEFIVMASMLLEIKSKMLLPDHQMEAFDFENEEDPRYELISKLMEYKKYKELGKKINERQIEQSLMFTDQVQIFSDPDLFKEDYENMRYEVELLKKAFEAMLINLKRFDQEKLDYFTRIRRERFSLENKVSELREYFNVSRKVTFNSLFDGYGFIEEFITTFLAVLEILKTDKVRVVQNKQFDEILLISEVQNET